MILESEAATIHRGACFCGAVQIEAAGAPLEMGYCHCSSCRSWSAAPVTAFILWKSEQVRVAEGKELLAGFNKSGFSNRRFCTICGGHVMVGHPKLGFADVPAATLPGLAFRPSVHLNYAETVMRMNDGLPKLRDFPAHVGGSGRMMIE